MRASWRPYAAVGALALGLRLLGAWWLGPGPFGPDGPGALAAVELGGHPYPLHPLLIAVFGPRGLSVLGGTLAAMAAARLAAALGGSALGAGLLVACAPLLLQASALAGGDAAATGVAAAGVALAFSGWPLLGGALAGLSLGVKPIALPLLPALLWVGLREGETWRSSARAALGALLGGAAFVAGVSPLLRPRPASGLLGTWWLSSEGAPPPLAAWPGLLFDGAAQLAALPSWTGLHLIAALALLALARRPSPLHAGLLLLALLGLLAPSTLLGDALRPRYLGPASWLLTALAGASLRGRLAAGALAFAWPGLAFLSGLGALRASEEGLPAKPSLPWPLGLEVEQAYLDSGVCGAGELRALAATLAGELGPGVTLHVLRLRDGREGELTWPLLAARPDLRVALLSGGGCPEEACVEGLSGSVVFVDDPSGCQTPVVDFGEQALAAALRARWGGGAGVYGVHR